MINRKILFVCPSKNWLSDAEPAEAEGFLEGFPNPISSKELEGIVHVAAMDDLSDISKQWLCWDSLRRMKQERSGLDVASFQPRFELILI